MNTKQLNFIKFFKIILYAISILLPKLKLQLCHQIKMECRNGGCLASR